VAQWAPARIYRAFSWVATADVSALRQQVTAFVNTNLSPAARSATLARLAVEMRDGLISTGRASPVYRTFVDGREGAPEASVKGTGGGVILYRFGYAAQAAVFALAFLKGRSPSKSGKYRGSFYVGVNGRFIPAVQFDPALVPAEAEIVIGNTQPYSRRVDVQLVGGNRLHYSVPVGLFDDAARAVKRQFGGAVAAKRVYSIEFPGRYTLKGEGRAKSGKGTKVDSPALVITASSSVS
jgi:hypothetical protein